MNTEYELRLVKPEDIDPEKLYLMLGNPSHKKIFYAELQKRTIYGDGVAKLSDWEPVEIKG